MKHFEINIQCSTYLVVAPDIDKAISLWREASGKVHPEKVAEVFNYIEVLQYKDQVEIEERL